MNNDALPPHEGPDSPHENHPSSEDSQAASRPEQQSHAGSAPGQPGAPSGQQPQQHQPRQPAADDTTPTTPIGQTAPTWGHQPPPPNAGAPYGAPHFPPHPQSPYHPSTSGFGHQPSGAGPSAGPSSSPPPHHPPGQPLSSPSAARRGGRLIGAALLVGLLAGGGAGAGAAVLLNDDSGDSATQPLTVAPDQSSSQSGNTASSASSLDSTEAVAAKVLPSVVKIYGSNQQASGSGSGIILTADGQILTNNHVAELGVGGSLAVSFNDGSTAKATIVGRDPLTDLAVIQAHGVSGLTPATLGSSENLQVGQPVVAIGSPFGLESTVTTGIISALNRPVTTQGEAINDPTTIFPAIQTDAAINPGNSGGPLVNLEGQVIGINSAIESDSSSMGAQGGSIGLGFAIPISDAIPIAQELRNGESPTHARIGVTVGDAKDSVGLPDGALIQSIDPGTPAASAGLKKGDVISKVDDAVITDSNSLVATIRSYRPGDSVTLTIQPSTGNGHTTGDTHTVQLKLASD
jgi:putative serine protease PepD